MKKFRVYDNRDGKTLFEGSHYACLNYISDNFDEYSDEFYYLWIEEVSK
jgi:hypothetical protein